MPIILNTSVHETEKTSDNKPMLIRIMGFPRRKAGIISRKACLLISLNIRTISIIPRTNPNEIIKV
ncbi:MAG: hypothetical protein FWC19_02275 [Treponema sp.]|nr:hypothetical protein [Treponema sp.]